MALSQEQINALLEGNVAETESGDSGGGDSSAALSPDLSNFLVTLGKVAMEAGSSAVSQALGKTVTIGDPEVITTSLSEVQAALSPHQVLIKTGYQIGQDFESLLLIKDYDAAVIFDILMGKDGRNPDLDIGDLQVSAIGEVMNQLLGAAATSLSGEFGATISMKPPESVVVDMNSPDAFPGIYSGSATLVQTRYTFSIEGLLDSELYQFQVIQAAENMIATLSGDDLNEANAPMQTAAPAPPPQAAAPQPMQQPAPPPMQQPVQQPMQQPMAQQPMMQQQPMMVQQPMQQPMQQQSIRPAQFSPLDSGQAMGPGASMDLVMDIPLRVTVELGSAKLKIKDVLDLTKGSVVELSKLAGEPVDLLVNGKLMAKGEVVVVNENFGLRITEIAGQAERISGLKL